MVIVHCRVGWNWLRRFLDVGPVTAKFAGICHDNATRFEKRNRLDVPDSSESGDAQDRFDEERQKDWDESEKLCDHGRKQKSATNSQNMTL